MSFITQAYLLERYRPRLTMQELAEVLGIAHGTLRNRPSTGTDPSPSAKCRSLR